MKKMGDIVDNLSVNKELKVTTQDELNLYNFFDIELNNLQNTNTKDRPLFEIIKFVVLFTILFYICIHPASISRFVDKPLYKQILQTTVFASILFLYLYFNK